MSTFKITNITDYLGKRDIKYNSVVAIDYVDDMLKKTINIKAGETVYMVTSSLPISAHLLRVRNLITVTEVSNDEVAHISAKLTIAPQPVVNIKPQVPLIEQSKPIKKGGSKEEVSN